MPARQPGRALCYPGNNVMTKLPRYWRLLHVPIIGRRANRQIPISYSGEPAAHRFASRRAHHAPPARHYVFAHHRTGLYWRDPWQLHGTDPRRQWAELEHAYRFHDPDYAREMASRDGWLGDVYLVEHGRLVRRV